jgi:hypothetical protein
MNTRNTVKRYGFGVFGGFKQDQYDGNLVTWDDYVALDETCDKAEIYREKYLKERNELMERLKATDRKLTAVIAERDELRTQCDAKDSVIATYESAKFGLQCSQSNTEAKP